MSQHDYVISNQDGASFRADINDALASIVSCNSGLTAPVATFAYQVWHDTTTGIIKQRNGTNTAWLNLSDVLLAGKTVTGDVTVVGLLTYTNQLTASAAQATTSGTVKDFPDIPSWAKRITVSFNAVSTNGSSNMQVQLGDSGGFETTGYSGNAIMQGVSNATLSAGFVFTLSTASAQAWSGSLVLTNVSGNIWVANGQCCIPGGFGGGAANVFVAGVKTLSATLDSIRITTVNGTDTFDAGSVNIIYE